jgi:hypothetical protein
MGAGIELLNRHVQRFNAAVRTGDIEPMGDKIATLVVTFED